MSMIKKWEEKFPILFSIAVLVLFDVVTGVIGWIIGSLVTIDGYYLQVAASELLGAIAAAVLLILSGRGKTVFKSRKGFFKSLFVGMYEIVLIILAFLGIAAQNLSESLEPIGNIVIFIGCMLLVGIAEEVLFRGLITDCILAKYGKDRKGVILAVAVSGLIFGSAHLINIFLVDTNPAGVFIQVFQAAALGMFFGAVYMRTHNIFAVIFLHAAMDFVSLSASGLWGSGTVESTIGDLGAINLISVLAYLIPTIFIMRFSKLDEYLAERDNIKEST
ncbi:MAG: CPBP family intramembrane metalloprotease [Clostridia bacterium]|nr:CPBP family intramembrane metalloprotease [Clostridia bacterium]